VVAVTNAPKPPPIRITMTLPLINNARNVAVVASGPGKRHVLSQAWHPEKTPADLPIQQVAPLNGELQWFVDQAAAPSRGTKPHNRIQSNDVEYEKKNA
jgi:6-phosphogluconolactonase